MNKVIQSLQSCLTDHRFTYADKYMAAVHNLTNCKPQTTWQTVLQICGILPHVPEHEDNCMHWQLARQQKVDNMCNIYCESIVLELLQLGMLARTVGAKNYVETHNFSLHTCVQFLFQDQLYLADPTFGQFVHLLPRPNRNYRNFEASAIVGTNASIKSLYWDVMQAKGQSGLTEKCKDPSKLGCYEAADPIYQQLIFDLYWGDESAPVCNSTYVPSHEFTLIKPESQLFD